MKIFKDHILENAAKLGSRNAFLIRDRDGCTGITWQMLLSDIYALGTGMKNQGIGGHICILGENSYKWMLVHLTVVCGAGVAVPLDKDLSVSDLCGQITYTNGKAVFYSASCANHAAEIAALLPNISFICMDSEDFTALMSEGTDLLASGDTSYKDFFPGEDECAAVMLTSGTTGGRKGVMISQKNIMACVSGCKEMMYFDCNDRVLMLLPLYHGYSCFDASYLILYCGGVLCVCSDFKRIVGQVRYYKTNKLFFVPALVKAFLTELEKAGQSSDEYLGFHIDYIISGGAPLSTVLVKKLAEYGVKVLEGYGITECTSIISVNSADNPKLGTVGCPPSLWKVKISDEGEILVKGDNVMIGYYGNPEIQKEVMADGWFRTGDIGSVDDDGYITVKGRMKNMIILDNGKNVFPEELEEMIQKFDGIKEVMVYEHDKKIVAEAYSSLSEQDFIGKIAQLNRTLPMYKRIHKAIVRNIPFEKSSGQKIIRR